MNKPSNAGAQGGGVGNFGPGGVAGPTAAAAAQAAQRQRSLLQRADADIGSLLDNFSHLLKAARVRGCFPFFAHFDSGVDRAADLSVSPCCWRDFRALVEFFQETP